jgi:alpha-L-fucosidase
MASWFDDARLGLFVHWGPYSAARLEPSWPMVGGIPVLPCCQSLTVGEYDALTAGWSPPAGAVRAWADLVAGSGADYAVLTTKHHDGFTLFPTSFGDHGIHVTAPGRDLVGEYVAAMREAGVRVGLYFSLPDWHHQCYPAFRDEMRPYPALGYPRPAEADWARFLSDQRGQLDEILTRYGTIDLLWFDGGWERTAEEWQAGELEHFIRRRQSEIVINDRCPGIAGYGSMLHEGTVPLDGGSDPWEACVPLDDSWGPLEDAPGRKSVAEVVGLLLDAAAAGGRLLLNIAPLGSGELPGWQRDRVLGLSRWVEANHDAIDSTEPAGLDGRQFYGQVTRRGDRYFLACTPSPAAPVVLRAVKGRRIVSASVLASGTPVPLSWRTSALERMLNAHDPTCDVVLQPPAGEIDSVVTVIDVRTDGGLA